MYELALVAFIPILGVIVRYRATYHPKKPEGAAANPTASQSLPSPPTLIFATTLGSDEQPSQDVKQEVDTVKDELDNAQDGPGVVNIELGTNPDPVPESTPAPTFTRVWKSVWREEKAEGLFKGFFPGFLFSFFIFLRGFVSPAPVIFMRNYQTVIPTNFFYLPYMVATYRIIVSPHKLRVWEPKEMYRLIFSDYERQHPFRAIRYSPIVLPFIAALLFEFFVLREIRNSLAFNSPIDDFEVEPDALWTDNVRKGLHHILWWEVGRLLLYPLLAIVCTLVMTPVDVIITRLAIQPVHGPPQTEPMEERDVEKSVVTTAPPSYLHLTTERRPYAGFVDCFKRIVEEEGWGVLYRSWVLTFVGYLVPPLR